MTKEERLNRIEQELRLRNDIGGTDKDWMLKIIREQDAALAEAREVLEFYGNRQLYDAADSQISGCPIENDEGTQARTWLAAHPAKECNCRLRTPAPRMFEHASDCAIYDAPAKKP